MNHTQIAAQHVRRFKIGKSNSQILALTGIHGSTILRAGRGLMGFSTINKLAPHIAYIEDHIDELMWEASARMSNDNARRGPTRSRPKYGFPEAYINFVSGRLGHVS